VRRSKSSARIAPPRGSLPRLDINRSERPVPARVDVIGVPMDLGADRRGVDMGPSAVRYARLSEGLRALGVADARDHGNVPVQVPESAPPGDENAKYLTLIQRACADLAGRVEQIVRDGGLPLVIGGDHSIAMGTLAGLRRGRERRPGLIWIDAHADINTPESSESGNVHGMPVSFAIANGDVAPERIAYIGLRDLDAGERRAIRDYGIRAYTMTDIDRLGMERVIEESILITAAGSGSVHVSFDMDGIDPSEAPGVGTPVRGGMTYREAHLAMEAVSEAGVVGSLEFTEINPILDEKNRTAQLAVELILSALGKSII
jgi:arginase